MAKNAKPLTLLIRADAYRAIGTGHVMRCIALGQAWKVNGGNVLFTSYCESDVLQSRLNEEGFSYIPIQKPHPHPSDLDSITALLDNLCATEQRDRIIVALDGYHFDGLLPAAQSKIKDFVFFVLMTMGMLNITSLTLY